MKPTILLTRGVSLNEADKQFFEQLGYQTIIVPLSEIQPLPLNTAILEQLSQSEWLFFTSQSPILSLLKHARKEIKIAVIGQKTAAIVRKAGFSVTFISPIETKEAMITFWRKQYPRPTTIFYPKSQLADSYIEESLSHLYRIYAHVTYENRLPKETVSKLSHLSEQAKIQAVYLTSPSSWHRFYQIYKNITPSLTLIAIGPTTKKAIETDGFQAIVKSDWIEK
ncbi:uroporphyrinogen-III synthase [Enterococcus phoeniculicola]|jgi:uroporphyrinogen-III synthase|uniref:Uroporphyrinogen-III synthase n=1 Tax=Enterococcus phoeniculicola ATCC BAA-412 TaxID=1158610 RepID=R3TJU5_9ENTE|nr:uroporphyrinogen-III synthase [Enterococcus phoeniculicola]EOL41699.1 hypothetical protein UC3_03264 [Enterococcus phoeniculicola ATCC BAA-412]EOT78807.1 hypothetical protein I589_00312 [Enterococcus phoeniculicola ATCC BAA-412]